MSEFKRKVNDPLRLKLSLSDGNTARFVRAFLFDQNGAVVAPGFVNLSHQSNGIYADNSVLMPNLDQVVAKYKVYYDNTYLESDLCYPQAIDYFEKDAFDPTAFIPKGQNVFATMGTQKTSVIVGTNKINVTLEPKPLVEVSVKASQVGVELKTKNEIEGELND